MKIFYKKDFQRVLAEKHELKREFEQYKIDTSNSINALEDRNFALLQENSNLKNLKLNIDVVKEELQKEKRSKGGYVKENNKLKKLNEEYKKEIDDLKAKIEDLKSDRYLIKKIPSGRTKNTLKTKIAPQMKPSVRKFMKDNFD